MNEKPNYYGILPAHVRYAKIKPMAKIMYTEITALSNKHGYCHASNAYFADLYEVHKNTVSLWINELEKNGFVKIKITKLENGFDRKIFIQTYQQKAEGVSTKTLRGYQQKAEHNITSIILQEKREKNNKNSLPEKKEKDIKQSEKINNTIYELYLARKKEFLQTYNNLMYQARGVNLISKADEFYTFRNSYTRAKKDKRENQILNQDEFRRRAINYLDSTAEPYKQKSFKQFIKLIENFDEKQNLYNEKQEHDIYANLEII